VSLKDQLTPEQWKAVFNAPIAAATYVATASGGGFEMIKEIMEAGKFMTQAAQAGDSSYGELVSDYLTIMKGMSKDEIKANSVQYENTKDVNAVREQTKQTVASAWAAISGLPGADGFARWILQIGRTTALAKTGGHFGIGNKSVIDEQEQAALDALAAELGLPANN
jgi:hypothetical protein